MLSGIKNKNSIHWEFLTLCLTLLLATTLSCSAYSPQSLLTTSKQLILVEVADINNFHASLRLYQRQRVTERWKSKLINGHSSIAVVIGSSGLAWPSTLSEKPMDMQYKKEGDNRSPAGIFTLPVAFGIKQNINPMMPYIHINKNIICVDDSNSKFYNKIINLSTIDLKKDWARAEIMNNEAPMYNAGLQIAYNPTDLPGNGSCIFVHQWRRPSSGTAGCTAMDKGNMKYLMGVLKQQDDPVLVQLPQKEYLYFQKKWGLPALG